jgi:hypothetical protein
MAEIGPNRTTPDQPPDTAGITWIVESGRTAVSRPAGSWST